MAMPKQTAAKFPEQAYSPRQIRALRAWLGINQETFAEMIGVGKSLVWEWERGSRLPKRQEVTEAVDRVLAKARLQRRTNGQIVLHP